MSATPESAPETQAPRDAQSHRQNAQTNAGDKAVQPTSTPILPREIGGRDGPEPTRFGDWEKAGRCIDF
jgi:hypothetical protein